MNYYILCCLSRSTITFHFCSLWSLPPEPGGRTSVRWRASITDLPHSWLRRVSFYKKVWTTSNINLKWPCHEILYFMTKTVKWSLSTDNLSYTFETLPVTYRNYYFRSQLWIGFTVSTSFLVLFETRVSEPPCFEAAPALGIFFQEPAPKKIIHFLFFQKTNCLLTRVLRVR